MALSKPIPVRISERADQRLAEIAESNGMTKAELMRLCVDRFLNEVESTGRIEISQVVHDPRSTYNAGKSKTA